MKKSSCLIFPHGIFDYNDKIGKQKWLFTWYQGLEITDYLRIYQTKTDYFLEFRKRLVFLQSTLLSRFFFLRI